MDYIFNQLKEGKIGKNVYLHNKYIYARARKSEEDNGEKKGSAQERRQTVCYGRLGATNRESVHALPPRI